MELQRDITCTCTGHRPECIPFKQSSPSFKWLCTAMDTQIRSAYDRGYRIFLTGGDRGADLWFAERILLYKKNHHDVQLVAYLPYHTQTKLWPSKWKNQHANIISQVDALLYAQRNRSTSAVYRRNRLMIERSSLVIAVFDGSPNSVTARIIGYAENQEIPVEIIDPLHLV